MYYLVAHWLYVQFLSVLYFGAQPYPKAMEGRKKERKKERRKEGRKEIISTRWIPYHKEMG